MHGRGQGRRQRPQDLSLGAAFWRESPLRAAIHGADVVLAVKLGPFAAHCWTQIGDQVLNDTPEEVARFTPILVA